MMATVKAYENEFYRVKIDATLADQIEGDPYLEAWSHSSVINGIVAPGAVGDYGQHQLQNFLAELPLDKGVEVAALDRYGRERPAVLKLKGAVTHEEEAQRVRKAAPKPDVLQSARVFEHSRVQYATLTSGAVMVRCLLGSGRWFRDAYSVEQTIRTFRKDEITDPARVAGILDSLRGHLEGVE